MIDQDIPAVARVRNYLCGGKDNYSADREVVERVREIWPGIEQEAREARRFSIRALEMLAQEGADQYLVFGAGFIPRAHVVQQTRPQGRIWYADDDPLVLAHGRALYSRGTAQGRIGWGAGTLMDWRTVLDDARRCTLDSRQPIVVSLIGVEYMSFEVDAVRLVHDLFAALPAKSVLVLCQAVNDPAGVSSAVQQQFRWFGVPWTPRSTDEFREFFAGMEMVGDIAPPHQWRQPHLVAPTDAAVLGLVGVGIKP